MQQRLQVIGEDYRVNKERGVDMSTLPNLDDDTTREALAEQYLTIGLAIAGILEWEGILNNTHHDDNRSDNENSNDEIAPVTQDNITQLFNAYWVIAETFRQQYTGMRELLDSEKNVSRPACTGTATAGRSIAPTVPNNTSPAHKGKPVTTGKSARTSATN